MQGASIETPVVESKCTRHLKAIVRTVVFGPRVYEHHSIKGRDACPSDFGEASVLVPPQIGRFAFQHPEFYAIE